ncbi:MAG: D-sorbitol dehydrogenase [Rhizobacter sp.]|nr:D-sorbitol dehydrogenase [Rhizobacter sp.]
MRTMEVQKLPAEIPPETPPEIPLLSRRRVLTAGAGVALVGSGWWFWSPDISAQPASTANTLPVAAKLTAAEAAFVVFSKAITGHADLEPQTGQRIHQAMAAVSSDFVSQAARLATLVSRPMAPKAVLAAASAAGLRDTALAVVAAWYTGTVAASTASGAAAVVVSYQQALMYRPVQDAQAVPTYCNFGPAWWTQAPPPVRVSAPVEKPATPAPTTGNPMPVSGSPPPPNTAPQSARGRDAPP